MNRCISTVMYFEGRLLTFRPHLRKVSDIANESIVTHCQGTLQDPKCRQKISLCDGTGWQRQQLQDFMIL